jgi:hypothetical protein
MICDHCLKNHRSHYNCDPVESHIIFNNQNLKGTQVWDSFDFFWPKSKPYMTLVNIFKKFESFILIFPEFRGDWANAEPIFCCEVSDFFFHFHFGPIRWDPWRFFKISIIYRRYLACLGTNYSMWWLSICGNDFIACWAYAEIFQSRISWPNRMRFSIILCYREQQKSTVSLVNTPQASKP